MIIKNTYTNIIGNIFSACIGFIIYIMLFRVYGASIIGKIAYMTGLVGLITFVVDLGIDQAGQKYMAEKKSEFIPEFIAYFFIKVILLSIFVIIGFISVCFIFRVDDQMLFILIMSNIFCENLSGILKNTLTARRSFYQLVIRTNISRVVRLCFAILFCTQLKSIYLIALLPSIEGLCSFFTICPYILKKIKGKDIGIQKQMLKKYISYAWPLSLSTGITLSLANLDKVIIGGLVGHAYTGYLVIAEKIFLVFDIIIKAITQQLLPEITYRLANFKEKYFRLQIEKIILLTNFISTLMILILILYADLLVVIVFGAEGRQSAIILRMFALIVFAKLFFRPYNSLIFATEKHKLFLWLTIPTQMTKIGLIYFLAPQQVAGMVIGGMATPLAKGLIWFFPRGLCVLYVIKKHFNTLFLGKTKLLLLLFIFMLTLAILLDYLIINYVMIIIFGIFLIGAYFSILYFANIISKEIIDQLLDPLKDLKRKFIFTKSEI